MHAIIIFLNYLSKLLNLTLNFKSLSSRFLLILLSCLHSSMICSQFHSQSYSNVNIHGDTKKASKHPAVINIESHALL